MNNSMNGHKMNGHKQGGFSGLCFFSILLMVLAITFMSVRMLPVYLSDRSIVKALDELTVTPGLYNFNPDQMLIELKRAASRTARLKSDERDMAKIGYVRNRAGAKIVGVNYEVVVPILFNLSFLVTFKHEVEIRPYSGKQL